jgi:hypothetical protein
MPQALPRFYRQLERREDERRLARLRIELGDESPLRSSVGATTAGDERRLRGVPRLAVACPARCRTRTRSARCSHYTTYVTANRRWSWSFQDAKLT